ncbi:glycosyltransferase family 39 protein [Actinomadura sp. ATCC 31491]|uniref:Glycosyltransferase family 39 protein n=1 Tax=Actinomadura luzonensis TaxID=2805427 RepID=A0ABT0G9F2_9ACTN|nr:glycosyltransferase family 39 protein [Actinomadura luzonensis]MCK2221211.1 glycosyltransferase family 39 protein [Actinomadura luzonensis]
MERLLPGRTLAALSAAPALAVAGWLLAGLPLLLLGRYAPLPALLLGLPAAALLCWAGTRRGPAVEAAWWQVAAVAGVAVASGVFNAVLHSEQLAVRRDPATYAQYTAWIARHGALPIGVRPEAFGGADPALLFDSVGFYPAGAGAVTPQFMPGAPMLFAVGDWLGAPFAVPAVLGALAVLTVAGVTARLAGARWAVVAAVAFAVSLPVLYTSRTTFSEIPSLVLLFGGLALAHDALERPGWGRGLLAGLVFGLSVLVRIDGLRDVLPVLGYAGLLIAARRRDRARGARGTAGSLGPPLLAGLAAGAGTGLLAAYLLARSYLDYLSGSVRPLLLICGAVLVATAAGTAAAPLLARLRPPRWLPATGAGLVVLVMAALYARPWFQTVTRVPVTADDRRTYEMIETIQRANRLPVDGTRLYFENSLHWVAWYVGLPVIVLATLAAALLVRRLLRDGTPFAWLLPLAVIGWTTVTTLVRPEITPDHPWAARRLVPVVIPGLVVLAAYGLERLRARTGGRRWVSALAVLAVLVPPAVTSIGTAFTPVERGEAAAVAAMCAKLPANASVLIVERVTGDRFTQVVRGMCDRPAARVRRAAGVDVARDDETWRLAGRIRAAGRVPVVLAADADQVARYGAPVHVLSLRTRQDERSLAGPPDGTYSLTMNVWMAVAA